MKSNINTRLYLGFASAIFLVLMVGLISYATFSKQNYEAGRVKHSYQVMNKLFDLQNLITDMETGRRGFRSTNQKLYLEPYYSALAKFEPALGQTRQLLLDNPRQLQALNKTEYSIRSLMSYWRSLGEDAGGYTRERIREIVAQEKSHMGLVRLNLQEMMDVELNLLSSREDANRKSIDFAIYELVIGILLIILIVGVLIYQILKELNSRKKAELALQNNNTKLEAVYSASAEKNWLLAGLAEVNESLQGLLDTKELCKIVLNKVVNYLQVSAGGFYLYEENSLVLKSSVSLPATAQRRYNLNEGFVGRAASQTAPLLISDIPPKWITIQGGTIAAEPVQAIYAPLYLSGELKGLIELLTFEHFDERHTDFIKLVGNNIAVALNSAQSREKVLLLLEKVQQQKEELETQQEELRQTNEELSMQTEVLQTSEEELRIQEQELRQINAELEEKNETIESATKALMLKASELESSNKYKSEFLANMSHELRTPLNSVLILAKLLEDNVANNLTEKQVSHAKIIHKSGSDLLQLINDILDLSKIESGTVEINYDEIPISLIASDMKQLFSVIAEERNIQFKVNIDPLLPQNMVTDRRKAEQVIKNLLSNAIKFTPANGKVELNFKRFTDGELNMVNIEVKDSGIGIPVDKQSIIFDPFQQADGSTSRKYGGTGLGLSISRELVRVLGGNLDVESEVGSGSTFTITLPLKRKTSFLKIHSDDDAFRDVENALIEQQVISDDRNGVNVGDKVMLIIEDDQVFATVLRNLARQKGYKTIVAIKGDEGLHYAIEYKPDAIILDMKLPVIDGSELLHVLKNNKSLKHIPVHIVSAYDEQSIDSSAALSFLKKPAQPQDIERAFTLLGEYLQSSVKKVLLFSGQQLKDQLHRHLVSHRQFDVSIELAALVEDCLQMIHDQHYDCVIADIGNDIEVGIVNLRVLHMRLAEKNIPIIIYLDKDISAADEMELRKVSEVIIRESSYSYNRLVDELELFLYSVQEKKSATTNRSYTTPINSRELKGKKVLLVDDDMRNIFALTAVLEVEEMDVLTASDGKEGLTILKENPEVDIILMDIMMPEMDGYEAMNIIRNDFEMSKLPIIALTAKAMAGDREKCIKAGASDYITKPVDTQKLVSLMRVWLS